MGCAGEMQTDRFWSRPAETWRCQNTSFASPGGHGEVTLLPGAREAGRDVSIPRGEAAQRGRWQRCWRKVRKTAGLPGPLEVAKTNSHLPGHSLELNF